MINAVKVVSVALGAALAVAGCAEYPHETAGTSVVLKHADGTSVIFEGNTRLKNRVEVTAVTYDKTPSGMNRVNVQLTSVEHRNLFLQYRIAWYNAEGMELDADSRTYRPLNLDGLDAVTVTGVANSPEAVTSRIRIRELRAAGGYDE